METCEKIEQLEKSEIAVVVERNLMSFEGGDNGDPTEALQEWAAKVTAHLNDAGYSNGETGGKQSHKGDCATRYWAGVANCWFWPNTRNGVPQPQEVKYHTPHLQQSVNDLQGHLEELEHPAPTDLEQRIIDAAREALIVAVAADDAA